MTSQSVMVRFACLRAAGSTVGGNFSRCTERERVGVEFCVSGTDVDTQYEIHEMTAHVVPRHQRT